MDFIEEDAVKLFREDCNCAQSVLMSHAEKLGIEKEFARDLATGFGAGMAYQQKTCGSVSAAYMVLDLLVAQKYDDPEVKKEKSYELIQKFNQEFEKRNGAVDCSSLLNCDLSTDQGKEFIEKFNLYEVVCEKCIRESVRIIDEIAE